LEKTIIKGMNQAELQSWCVEAGETKFRGVQLFEWMYRHGITSFASMSNVNKSFRVYLEENCIIQTLRVENSIPSQKEASVKILFRTDDDQFIETVSMVDGNRHTVCISSQVGCALDCSFCATGQMGLERNLSTGEIIDQLIFVRENIKQPITNVVFMGMGEPFHNYENVLNAADIFHSPKGFNLASTRITISTVGLLPQIKQFIKEKRRFKLAISLNAADDGVRSSIMPVNKKWSIADLIETGKEYSNQKKRLVMFEYVLLKGINDSEDDALNLAQLLKGVSCKINLIPYNETNGMYRRPDEAVISRFSEILHKNRDEYRVLVRWSKGQDIKAGCGQLAGQKT
jgi:23S rRNA (adenine2503-C2)-methyltransferase